MPKRSNPFQRLVKVIERQLWPEAELTESAKIGGREIDILIEHEAGGTEFRIAVECRDRTRTDSVTWIDSLVGKYLQSDPSQQTNPAAHKVLAVSSSGFSDKARHKAEESDLGIELLTLSEAEKVEWGNFELLSEKVTVRQITAIPSTKIGIHAPPTDLSTKLRLMDEEQPDSTQLFLSEDPERSVIDYVKGVINEPHVMQKVASSITEAGSRLHAGKGFTDLTLPLSDREIELEDNQGGTYDLHSVTYHFAYGVREQSLSLIETAYRDVRTLYDSDNVFGAELSIALVENETEEGVRLSVAFAKGDDEYLLETQALPFKEASMDLFMFAVADMQDFEPPGAQGNIPKFLQS